jgi:hypothetical protein
MTKPNLRNYQQTCRGPLEEIGMREIMYEFAQRQAKKVVMVAEMNGDGKYIAKLYIPKREFKRSENEERGVNG